MFIECLGPIRHNNARKWNLHAEYLLELGAIPTDKNMNCIFNNTQQMIIQKYFESKQQCDTISTGSKRLKCE